MKKWLILGAMLVPCVAFAASTDLTIGQNDISFVPATPLLNVKGKIYATVHNIGPVDAEGTITFYDNDTVIGSKPFSARGQGLPEEIWLNWTPTTNGTHTVRVSISVDGGDTNTGNNTTSVNVKIDKDTDGDGIPDSIDDDIDNDGLTNAQEKALGTDPYKIDTDQDGVDDLHDAYPLDPSRSKKPVVAPVVTTAPVTTSVPSSSVTPKKSTSVTTKSVATTQTTRTTPASTPVVTPTDHASTVTTENQAVMPPVQELPPVQGAVLGVATETVSTTQNTPVSSTTNAQTSPVNSLENTNDPFDWTVVMWILAGLCGAGAGLFGFIAWKRDRDDS